MNIINHIVTSANWTAGRESNKVTGIVLHTMVGTVASSQSRFDNPASQVSVHYGVGEDGSITRWVYEPDTAWQAGNWDVNLKTIGIEHEDKGNYNDATRTPELYDASASLVADICKRYGFPADSSHIFLHKNVIDTTRYPGGTACPDGLDTNKIIAMAAAKLEGEIMIEWNAGDTYNLLSSTLGTKYADKAKAGNYWHELVGKERGEAAFTIVRSDQFQAWLKEVKAGTPTPLKPGLYQVN